MTPKDYGLKIVEEIQLVLGSVRAEELARFVQEVLRSERIFLYGLGRILLMLKAFAMRLVHLGIDAKVIGDVTTPSVGATDLVIVGSASGETETSFLIAGKAKALGARVLLISSRSRSRIARSSDVVVEIPAPAKSEAEAMLVSIQPMATLFEQSMLLLLDAVVLALMEKKQVRGKDMLGRHFNLE